MKPARTRRGSAMVESAIYMPMMILCIMFTIYTMINMYSQTALQAHLHIAVRAESGKMAKVTKSQSGNGNNGSYDRYRSAAFAKRIKVKAGGTASLPAATASVSQRYFGGRLTRSGGVKVVTKASSYAIREIDGMRKTLRV